jgi:cytoskeletal protein RodZ
MFESIGQRLKKEREARYLTLEKASEATRIRIVFLQALESDDYSVMPSAAQGRGFLRNYAEYLELNIDEMIAEIQKNAPASTEISGPLPQVNLVETEIPSLTESQDEKPARPSWVPRLGRRPKAEPVTDEESTEEPSVPAAEVEAEQPKPRVRRKKKVVEEEIPQQAEVAEVKAEDAILPIDQEQVEVNAEREAKPSLLSKFAGIFRSREEKVEPKLNEESAPAIESESQQAVPAQPADMIFAEIGGQLRERREFISLTFDEVERHTKLRAAFVKALEEGAFDKLPSPVQTRGMLANYATFLDLDVDTILLRFADGLQARRYEKYAETPREKIQMEVVTSIPFLRSFIAGDLIFGVVIISILIALAVWGVGRVVNSQDAQDAKNAQVTAPSIVDVLGSTPLPTATFISVEDNSLTMTVTADPLITVEAPTSGVNANVTVSIFAVERAFARISVDGEVVFEDRFIPGQTKVFEAENQVSVLTGNAAALRITYNGRDLGLMGNVGEVVSRVYLITGVAVPTATISPTPTNTLPATITPVPSLTPTITPTATPPDGG